MCEALRDGREGRREHILFHDQDHVILRLEGVIELNEVHVIQLVHDVNLVLHFILRRQNGPLVR